MTVPTNGPQRSVNPSVTVGTLVIILSVSFRKYMQKYPSNVEYPGALDDIIDSLSLEPALDDSLEVFKKLKVARTTASEAKINYIEQKKTEKHAKLSKYGIEDPALERMLRKADLDDQPDDDLPDIKKVKRERMDSGFECQVLDLDNFTCLPARIVPSEEPIIVDDPEENCGAGGLRRSPRLKSKEGLPGKSISESLSEVFPGAQRKLEYGLDSRDCNLEAAIEESKKMFIDEEHRTGRLIDTPSSTASGKRPVHCKSTADPTLGRIRQLFMVACDDIKESILDLQKAVTATVKNEMSGVQNRIGKLESMLVKMRNDCSVKNEVSELLQQMGSIESVLSKMKSDFSPFRTKVTTQGDMCKVHTIEDKVDEKVSDSKPEEAVVEDEVLDLSAPTQAVDDQTVVQSDTKDINELFGRIMAQESDAESVTSTSSRRSNRERKPKVPVDV